MHDYPAPPAEMHAIHLAVIRSLTEKPEEWRIESDTCVSRRAGDVIIRAYTDSAILIGNASGRPPSASITRHQDVGLAVQNIIAAEMDVRIDARRIVADLNNPPPADGESQTDGFMVVCIVCIVLIFVCIAGILLHAFQH